jgi:hypothetical protein
MVKVKDCGINNLFSPVKLLEPPCIVAPLKLGMISMALQFIIPGLHISEKEEDSYLPESEKFF